LLEKFLECPGGKKINEFLLCGDYGDSIYYPDLFKLIERFRDRVSFRIITNGSRQTEKFWNKLAGLMTEKDCIVFSIDGLENTNHLYRINVSYKKVIENLTAFNQAGGQSIWNYLVFEHNQHQVEEAKELALSLGCKEFGYKSTSRFVDKTHTLVTQSPVLGESDQILYFLKPTTYKKYQNQGYDDLNNIVNQHRSYPNYLANAKIDCFAKKLQNIYISAEGDVFPCGWLADRMYGYESESHSDHTEITKMISSVGRNNINIAHSNLQDILNGQWFQAIEDSWVNNSIQRCAHMCGEKSTLIINASKGQFKSLIEP
jgi:MoaA/NifB/PqqE/SkfB family radical SAM enzyme